MSTVIDTLERKEANSIDRLGHMERLMAALAPDPSQWEYTGCCSDAGPMSQYQCACGHPIRMLFHICRPSDGATAIVGSTCIEHFQGINPGLYASLQAAAQKVAEDLRAAKAQAKKASDDAKVEEARGVYLAARERVSAAVNAYYSSHGAYAFLPEALYSARRACGRKEAPEYKRACDYVRWYTAQAKAAIECLECK